MILHVDANGFYAACERLFRPDLNKKPIAVLSNNDGVTIALNQECKDLGFKRGDIYFKEKETYAQKEVEVFSSNYTLYADICRRLNLLYEEYAEKVEMYSIDESFLYVPDCTNIDYTELGRTIRSEVKRQIHMPVSVGVAPTKTLAKMCNKLAKNTGGVFDWNNCNKEETLRNYKVEDVWGIGHSKAFELHRLNVKSAYDLSIFPLDKAKKLLSITGVRTVQELNGIQALDSQDSRDRQNITSSKSFAHGVTEYTELETALSEYTQLAVTRMRSENSECKIICIYLMTARAFCENDKDNEYFNAASYILDEATSYLPEIIRVSDLLLKSIYRYGYKYRKIMVNLLGLEQKGQKQLSLFDYNDEKSLKKKESLMEVCDTLNEKYGRGCLHTGTRNLAKPITAEGKKASWIMERKMLSPEYTTNISSIPEVL